MGTKREPKCSGASLAFQFFLLKTRFFSLLTIKVHEIRSAKFTYLELSKNQERNNTIISSNIKRKYHKLQTSWELPDPLCFFTLLPLLALPEGDLNHYEKFSVQDEIVAKNVLSSISHNAVSSKELGA